MWWTAFASYPMHEQADASDHLSLCLGEVELPLIKQENWHGLSILPTNELATPTRRGCCLVRHKRMIFWMKVSTLRVHIGQYHDQSNVEISFRLGKCWTSRRRPPIYIPQVENRDHIRWSILKSRILRSWSLCELKDYAKEKNPLQIWSSVRYLNVDFQKNDHDLECMPPCSFPERSR